jgi:hypothetical protein
LILALGQTTDPEEDKMIEKYFKAAHVLRRFRSSVVDDYLDGFVDSLWPRAAFSRLIELLKEQ